MTIELFSITYRPSFEEAPLSLVCQAFNINGEKLLWVDGLYPEEPVLISLASCTRVEWMGSFDELVKANDLVASRVLQANQGVHSPTLLARAIIYLRSDPNLDGATALSMAVEIGERIAKADEASEKALAMHLTPA